MKDHCANKHGRTCQKCNICNSTFQTEDMLQVLIRVKHKNLDCNECDLTTFSKDILENHQKNKHNNRSEVFYKHENVGKCSSCDYRGTINLNWVDTRNQHTPKQSLEYHALSVTLQQPVDILNKHMKIAMGHKVDVPCRYYFRGDCRAGSNYNLGHL